MLFNDHDILPLELPQVAQIGDLFELNGHRLLCGNSLNESDAKRLMNGAQYHLCVTDPPYGVSYNPQWRKAELHKEVKHIVRGTKIAGDDNMEWLNFVPLFNPNVLYMWCASIKIHKIVPFCEKHDYILKYVIVWNKDQMIIGRGDYHHKYEPCLYFVKKGKKHNWQGSRKETTVWDIDTLKSNSSAFGNAKTEDRHDHATQKPMECMRRPIENNSTKGEIIVEPFLGSGTTLVAAEITQRLCYACEINPAFVDMAIRRWIKIKQNLNQPYEIKRNGVAINDFELNQ